MYRSRCPFHSHTPHQAQVSLDESSPWRDSQLTILLKEIGRPHIPVVEQRSAKHGNCNRHLEAGERRCLNEFSIVSGKLEDTEWKTYLGTMNGYDDGKAAADWTEFGVFCVSVQVFRI